MLNTLDNYFLLKEVIKVTNRPKEYYINNSKDNIIVLRHDRYIEKKYIEEEKLPKDSWGNSFVYTQNGDGFEIISFGGDKQEGGSDDIYYSKCQEQEK